jgi:hypothetical protein
MPYKVYLLIPGSHPFSNAASVDGMDIICIGYNHAAGILLGCGMITSPSYIGIYLKVENKNYYMIQWEFSYLVA